MRPRISLVLVAVAVVVVAICELESVAAMTRWDPSDVGRTVGISPYLVPGGPPEGQHVLITVRVETDGDVRTYRYWVAPEEYDPGAMLVEGGIEADARADEVECDLDMDPSEARR